MSTVPKTKEEFEKRKLAFIDKCDVVRERILDKAETDGASATEQTVIINFFSKLIDGLG